jgi:hypothetical protein
VNEQNKNWIDCKLDTNIPIGQLIAANDSMQLVQRVDPLVLFGFPVHEHELRESL